MPPHVPESNRCSRDQPAIKDQSPLPDFKYLQGMLAINIKIDQHKEEPCPKEGRQSRVKDEIDPILKRDPDTWLSNFQEGENRCYGKAQNDKEPVSVNMETAELKQDGMHNLIQIPNPKSQTIPKLQFQMTKRIFSRFKFGSLEFIWDLVPAY